MSITDFILSACFIKSIKVFHLFSWMSWMAGLLYLPRMFVYHSQTVKGSSTDDLLCTMERRLYKYIMHLALIMTLLSGSFLSYSNMTWNKHWWYMKILLVLIMIFMHLLFGYYRKTFANRIIGHTTYFRVINEIPGIVALLIMIVVIFKPH